MSVEMSKSLSPQLACSSASEKASKSKWAASKLSFHIIITVEGDVYRNDSTM